MRALGTGLLLVILGGSLAVALLLAKTPATFCYNSSEARAKFVEGVTVGRRGAFEEGVEAGKIVKDYNRVNPSQRAKANQGAGQ